MQNLQNKVNVCVTIVSGFVIPPLEFVLSKQAFFLYPLKVKLSTLLVVQLLDFTLCAFVVIVDR